MVLFAVVIQAPTPPSVSRVAWSQWREPPTLTARCDKPQHWGPQAELCLRHLLEQLELPTPQPDISIHCPSTLTSLLFFSRSSCWRSRICRICNSIAHHEDHFQGSYDRIRPRCITSRIVLLRTSNNHPPKPLGLPSLRNES